MEKIEEINQNLEDKFNILYKKMNVIQDIVLRLKTELDSQRNMNLEVLIG